MSNPYAAPQCEVAKGRRKTMRPGRAAACLAVAVVCLLFAATPVAILSTYGILPLINATELIVLVAWVTLFTATGLANLFIATSGEQEKNPCP